MKTSYFALAALASALEIRAAEVSNVVPTPPYILAEKGAHHRTWQKVATITNASGQVIARTNQAYVELATGLHHQKNGLWLDSNERIEAAPGGAAATNGQHKVLFATDPTTEVVIDLETPDGKRLRSRVLGLSYFDFVTGSNVLIAEVKSCQGVIVPPNQVLYEDAFTDFKADLLCTFTLAGFEQDIVLRERPPTPEVFGLSSSSSVLQVLTEFLSPPVPNTRTNVIPSGSGGTLTDQYLDFDAMKIGPGRAFSLGESQLDGIPVSKEWVTTIEGRTLLVEQIAVATISNQLNQLPLPPQANLKPPTGSLRHIASTRRMLPELRRGEIARTKAAMRTAGLPLRPRGFVMDYTIITSQSNCTFQGDTTYYITNLVSLTGTTTIEGGAVIKFNETASASISIGGPVRCLTDAYRPAIFTSKFDSTVGDDIASGTPTNYGGRALYFFGIGQEVELSNLRIAYARIGIESGSALGDDVVLRNVQFVNCGTAVRLGGYEDYPQIEIYNGLIHGATNAFKAWHGGTVIAQHLTVEDCDTLAVVEDGEPTFFLRNCILANVGNCAAANGDHNGFYISPTFGTTTFTNTTNPFQIVGGGNYYLSEQCGFRNAGTNDIDSSLISALKQKTTYPPIIYNAPGAYFSTSLELFPQAQRDTDILDLGFHYDSIDFLLGGIYLTNGTIQVFPGTAIGVFGTNSWGFGLRLGENVQFLSYGSADRLNHVATYTTVQEQSPPAWQNPVFSIVQQNDSGVDVICRFTDFSVLAQDGTHLSLASGESLLLQDCQFHSGRLESSTLSLTNCLLERVTSVLYIFGQSPPVIRNNLIWKGTFDLAAMEGQTNFMVKDNLFDSAIVPDNVLGVYDGGCNAYVTNYDGLQPTFTNDVILLASPAYQAGPLGRYYLPTNSPVINAGSVTNAGLVGLHHFTTTTNQVKDGVSRLDISYHYAAVASSGYPIDTDNDGIPDFLEDGNGNGSVNSDETHWQDPADLGLKVWITRPRNGSTIP